MPRAGPRANGAARAIASCFASRSLEVNRTRPTGRSLAGRDRATPGTRVAKDENVHENRILLAACLSHCASGDGVISIAPLLLLVPLFASHRLGKTFRVRFDRNLYSVPPDPVD
jgi:hypothetical protein